MVSEDEIMEFLFRKFQFGSIVINAFPVRDKRIRVSNAIPQKSDKLSQISGTAPTSEGYQKRTCSD